MALAFLFDPNKQFQNTNGTNAVGGFLRVYLNGTDDAATTYKDFNETLNEADIELDANGRAVVIVDNTKTYRIEVYSFGGTLMWTVSNFTAQGGSGSGGTPVSIEGTEGEVDVDSYSSGGILHFVVGLAQTIKDTLTSLSSSVTSLMASIGLCELVSNKKDTLTGYEASTTDYPSIKAVVDFVNSAMQNMGGKLITDNGDPFTDSSDLPSTTPYNGVNIDDKDYAYVQNAGSAERWSATVVGSSVAWVQEYAINIPVFTPNQQAAIDSGATATKIGNYDSHLANTNNPHGVTYSQVGASPDTHTHQVVINGVTKTIDKTGGTPVDLGTYITSHQDLSGYLSKTGDGSDVTAYFTTAGSRNNISTGEKLSVIFGKIAKWFADLKAVAFSGSYNDLSNKPTIPVVNNGILKIQQNGSLLANFYANDSLIKFVNIITPTKTSDLENDSDFLTEVRDYNIYGTISDEHIASASTWNEKLSPSGNGSNVTATFSEAGARSNIGSGESLSTIFGKVKKFFSDLKAVAFTGNYSDLSGTPEIPEAATATPQPVSSSEGSTGSSSYFAKGDHVHKIVVKEGTNDGQVSIAGQSVYVKGWDKIYQRYMQTSSGTKNLSFGSTTIIGSVNGINVVLSMPQANFISKDLDLAKSFSLSVCQFVCFESVPPSGTWHRYDGSDVCNAFKTRIGSEWGISATDYSGKANKATNDANGNDIVSTYATKTELSNTATNLGNSLSSAVSGIYDTMNQRCVRSASDYQNIVGKFTDIFSVKRESTSYVDAVVRLKVWGKYQYISASTNQSFCADITIQIRGESGKNNWTSAIADGCILYKGNNTAVSDLRVKMTTDSSNRLYISILASNASESYTRMIVESSFMVNNLDRATFSNIVSIYGSTPAGRSALGDEFSLN